MRSPGSPQSTFGLFGGPGFLLVCVLIVAICGMLAYLGLSGHFSSAGQATISLPGADASQMEAPLQAAAPAPPAGLADLKSMPAAPVAKDLTVSVAIEEDLSPGELLAKYPPDPTAALPTGTADLPTWKRFKRDSTVSAQAPRVALVITGLGRDRIDTVRAITGAPPEASLSFSGDAADLAEWIAAARAYGHEALLDLKLQSDSAEPEDSLALQLGPQENLRRLDEMLAQAPMIAGVAVQGSDSFLGDAAALQPLLRHLQVRQLAVIGLPITAPLTIAADQTIAGRAGESDIDTSIQSVMTLAQRRGAAVGIIEAEDAASLFPAWNRALVGHDEISLVPVSALVEE
ncbi:MAG TPA: divergent polysaccharide deacetylase family protein [Dongiaceae bacterium]